ncbi:uncharacterized protein LOC144665215 isoform X2 [Oculina patagonica]
MERRLLLIHGIILSSAFLKGFANDSKEPKLKLQLKVDDSEPLFQGNKTKLHLNVTHASNSSSTAIQVTLHIGLSFKGELTSLNLFPESVSPDVQGPNSLEFNKLDLQDEFSAHGDVSIDPDGLTEPGHLHVAHVIATLSYSSYQDNYTDPNTGEKVEKSIQSAYYSFYFYALDSLCVQPLGMKSGRIKESQILSSSFYKETHASLGHSPHQARLGGAGYWSPVGGSASIDSEQFLQIAFETPIQLKMIVIQGKPNSTEHVRTFDALTSSNGDVWRTEKAMIPKAVINVMSGDTAVPTVYQSVAATRFLRIQPRSWYKESALRVEVYGCVLSATETQDEFPSLGLEKQVIADAQITASSTSDPVKTSAASGRLNSAHAWCSATSNEQPLYLQIDLNEMHVITSISSHSRNTDEGRFESVTKYKLGHSEDGTSWNIYQQNGVDKEFLGNLVENIVTKHHLAIPVKARFVQFQPTEMISSVCMRVELYGEKSTIAIENTDKPAVYQRSILLDAIKRRLFLCNKDVISRSVCFIVKYTADESWIAMDRRIVSILGYDETKEVIYGVARNRKTYVRCNITKCVSIAKESWLAIRDSQTSILATEIVFVPETGHDFTDAPISVYRLTDNEGNMWGASAVGVHLYRVQRQEWELQAKWRDKDLNKCYSGPCENSGTCVGNISDYKCICPKGWTGKNCDSIYTPAVRPRVQAIDANCSGTLDMDQRTINSPYYPSSYGNSNFCTWLISSSHRVKLVFTSFLTESGFDILYVYDGTSTSSSLIGDYDGDMAGHIVESTGEHLYLEFSSDSSITYQGFFINLEAVQ